MTAFTSLPIFMCFGKILATGAPLLSCAVECSWLACTLQGQGSSFCFCSKVVFKLHLQTISCCLSLHCSATQSCSWKSRFFFFHTSVEMSQQILDALSFSSPCPTAVAEATVYGKSGCNHSEHAELEAPRNLRASTKCGELGSTHNFQMGKSSSMCS